MSGPSQVTKRTFGELLGGMFLPASLDQIFVITAMKHPTIHCQLEFHQRPRLRNWTSKLRSRDPKPKDNQWMQYLQARNQ